jgi:hypothetical protein
MKLTINAGAHARNHCPIAVPLPSSRPPVAVACGDEIIPLQQDGDSLVGIAGPMEAGVSRRYVPANVQSVGGVALHDDGTSISVYVNGAPFTTYRYTDVPARPYFWPVLAPDGTPVTRAWPMRDDVAGETRDHKHHRSMYFAFGDVNGVDNWSEEPGHGHTVHRSLDEIVSGPVFGRFRTTSDWTDAEGAPVLRQSVAVTFWAARGDGPRLVDVDLRLTPASKDVQFGDTKEGGMLTVRVATPMDVPNGGRIENSYGGINEPETWGYAAHWCDYSGVVNGSHVGIAVMDHPLSFRYPTYWHVRDYGLMGANPFALKAYTNGLKDGSHLLRMGEEMRFVYRVVVHHGNASDAGIREHYLGFVNPPQAAWTD